MYGNEDVKTEAVECGELISTCFVVLRRDGLVEPTIYLDFPPRIADSGASIYKCAHVFEAATFLRQHGVKRPTIKWLAK